MVIVHDIWLGTCISTSYTQDHLTHLKTLSEQLLLIEVDNRKQKEIKCDIFESK